jgi:hypothetical protein
MQHPFITDLGDKNLEELQTTLQGLRSKLNFAYRMQNQQLIQQLNMAIDSYQIECNKRLDDLYKKQNLNSRINVEKK